MHLRIHIKYFWLNSLKIWFNLKDILNYILDTQSAWFSFDNFFDELKHTD